MELRKIVRLLTVTIALGTLASSGALILITSYLHRLTSQIDDSLQSVRAAEQIQLQLLWHARNSNQAILMGEPQLAAASGAARSAVLHWYGLAASHVCTGAERAILDRLGTELEAYFADHAALEAAGLSPLDMYLEAVAPFQSAYNEAEELLRVNVEQAADATAQAHKWDVIARTIGVSVAVVLLLLTAGVIIGARTTVYRPLIALGDAMRRYAARDYGARAAEQGPSEIRAIGRSFNEMATALEEHRETQLSFVAAVAHDLRNPLAAMKMGVQAITAAEPAEGAQRHSRTIAMISRQIDVLIRMISDLLDSARVEAGQFTIKPVLCDARDLAAQTIELFNAASPLHEVRLRAANHALPVRCDTLRMGQVLNNIMSNAIKYSPRGGRIEIRASREGDAVLIAVEDSGLGIPADEHGAIFEPFRRGKSLGAIPGVGIGLSVARRIVEAHGGRITLESAVGGGATFSIRLPAAKAEPDYVAKIA